MGYDVSTGAYYRRKYGTGQFYPDPNEAMPAAPAAPRLPRSRRLDYKTVSDGARAKPGDAGGRLHATTRGGGGVNRKRIRG
jgi:hypothetical protein